jgi:phage terminase large subunit-like protein
MWPPAWLTPVDPAAIERGDGDFAADFAETFGSIGKDGVAGRAGTPLVIRPWQRELLRRLYARDENGGYIASTALIGLPRKNGKSALASSAIALYSLFAEDVLGGEIVVAAAEKEQARIVFGEAKRMIEATELSQICEIYKDSIYVPATSSVLKVVSAEAYSKEGSNPHRIIIDELHAHKNRDLYDVYSLAMANRGKIAQLVAITTAGTRTDSTGKDSIAYTEYQRGQKIARGEIEDPSFFMAWWEAAQEADHTQPETWSIANPAFGDLVAESDFGSAVKRTPEAEFRTKRLNQWVSSQQTWLPHGTWDALADDFEWDEEDEYVLGFDGSYSSDSTSICAVTIPQGDELPKVKLVATWEKNFGVDDDSWRVPIAEVENTLLDWCARYPKVREVACDPFRWQRSMEALQEAGLPIVEYKTSYLSLMIPASQKVFDAVVEKKLMHDGNPALARHLDNCVLKVDAKGARVTKEHGNSRRKIDNAIAFIIAFDRATQGKLEEEELIPQFFEF